MSDIDKPLPADAPNVTLTIRLLMTGKEVGSIIGKGGEIINTIREESGSKIHISDGSVPERIVTVTGQTESIFKSFNLICKKLEDEGPTGSHKSDSGSHKSDSESASGSSNKNGSVTLRLIVPASQCGSLIGKGGAKIKEIREVTGASVNVASEMLPNSTERTVTIGGTKSAIAQCIYQICCVMLESPPKGATIPYTPKSNGLGGGILGMGMSGGNSRGGRGGSQQDNPLASLLGLGSGASTLAAIASLAGSQLRDHRGGRDREESRASSNTQTHEMSIPNDMIGCIIGKGGSKIAEIRQLSGAMIRISKSDESAGARGSGEKSGEGNERQISISGNSDSVALAKSLINMSLELHKSRQEDRDSDRSSGGGGGGGGGSYSHGGGNSGAASLGLAQLLAQPEALTTALNTLASLSSLGGLGGLSALAGGGSNVHVTGIHRQRGAHSGNGGGGARSRDEDRGRDSKRSKFAPY